MSDSHNVKSALLCGGLVRTCTGTTRILFLYDAFLYSNEYNSVEFVFGIKFQEKLI